MKNIVLSMINLCGLALSSVCYAEEIVTPTTTTIPPINCQYQFDKNLKIIEPHIIEAWAKNATLQLFTMDPQQLDAQIKILKTCFTHQGWLGFNNAFEKSGNLEAIKTKALHVSASIKGPIKLELNKENQWKTSIPLDVTYQNHEHTIVQKLNVELLITREQSGRLGILQVIAEPQNQENPTASSGNPK